MRYAWIAALAVVLVGIGGRLAESCGPITSVMLFATNRHPPPGEHIGVPGVLRPRYATEDLLYAYRMLSGVHMSKDEVGARLNEYTPSPELRIARWVETRSGVATVPWTGVNPDRNVPGVDYQYFLNCLGDAFDTAAETLRQRIAKWHIDSANIAEWVRGQDQVFANCSGDAGMPEALTSGDPLLMADRRYQIAAAKFYATQFEEARADFEAIAADAESPWHELAPYLAARCFIRQSNLKNEERERNELLAKAGERLRAIINDPSQQKMRAAAKSLLGFVLVRIDPQQRLLDIEEQLHQPDLGADLQRALTDYSMTEVEWWTATGKALYQKSELTRWLSAVRGGEGAVDEWRTKRTMPWLVAALMSVHDLDAAVPELIAAARAVRPGTAAYPSVAYWGIRLQIRAGEADAARQWGDEALGVTQTQATLNLLRAERLKLARDWKEFLKFAPRQAVAVEEEGEGPPNKDELPAFDVDAVAVFHRRVPVRMWIDASKNDAIPANLQANLAQAAWVRAIILGDVASAHLAAARLGKLRPELAEEMSGFQKERDPAAARFAAVLLMLRGPGFEPVLRAGFSRATPVMEIDDYRDNWWRRLDGPVETSATDFLSKEDQAAGEEQGRRIQERGGNSVLFLTSHAIAWARSHPTDVRVPEALHLAVRATRFGSSNDNSKEAFDLLHRRYPKSEWTAKTKYWY
jgi:hypothetical protein